MKLYKGLFYSLAVAMLLTGCAKEDPFVSEYDGPTGTLVTRGLAPTLTNPEGLEVATRSAVPSADDFKVVITRQGGGRTGSSSPTYEFTYADMPEVLTLPTGDYKVYADYGENKPYAWDEPYYYGESTFGIEANKVTDDVDPIVAKLSNIRVTIVFHSSLLSEIGDDANVEVKVGDQGVLNFSPSESRSAYFKYVNKSQSLTATFSGMVEGTNVIVTKSYDNVAPGNHYRITFRLSSMQQQQPGTVAGDVTVDASIEKVDMNHVLDGEKENYLKDDWRPTQGGSDTPTPPADDKKAPEITSATPDEAGLVPVDLEKLNEVTDNTYCVLNIESQADGGITAFNVVIDSDTLTPDALGEVGLEAELDLVNPGSLEEPLTGLGLPVNVGGKDKVAFNITGFMPMLGALGEGTHNFILTVTDANGTTTKTLRLHTN